MFGTNISEPKRIPLIKYLSNASETLALVNISPAMIHYSGYPKGRFSLIQLV